MFSDPNDAFRPPRRTVWCVLMAMLFIFSMPSRAFDEDQFGITPAMVDVEKQLPGADYALLDGSLLSVPVNRRFVAVIYARKHDDQLFFRVAEKQAGKFVLQKTPIKISLPGIRVDDYDYRAVFGKRIDSVVLPVSGRTLIYLIERRTKPDQTRIRVTLFDPLSEQVFTANSQTVMVAGEPDTELRFGPRLSGELEIKGWLLEFLMPHLNIDSLTVIGRR